MPRIETDSHWSKRITSTLPQRWAAMLLKNWERQHVDRSFLASRQANITLRETVEKLQDVRLDLNSTDGDVVNASESLAVMCLDVTRFHRQQYLQRNAAHHFVQSRGCEPPSWKLPNSQALLRMTCATWWRRQLRKLLADSVERAAIELGYVNIASDLYASHETVDRRLQQIRRNEQTLASVTFENDAGQRYTLADIAAKGLANKTVRNAELMTRISGFEVIAKDMGHAGAFITLTCPSRMHKWLRLDKGKIKQNPNYDGTSPSEAQQYLCKCWARTRALLARQEINIYGFRVAEPHHDACPHWHMLVFLDRKDYRATIKACRRHFLASDGNEAGAAKHRVTYMHIKPSRGSASAYIAKYISKNIGTHHAKTDLFGNPIIETAQRVDAWASTWRIRQFQQLGGPPVGIWRALRRIDMVPDDAPQALRDAHASVHKIVSDELIRSASWAGYVRAQGGVFVGKQRKLNLEKNPVVMLNKYQEKRPDRVVGIAIVSPKEYFIGRFKALGEVAKYVLMLPVRLWQRVRASTVGAAPPLVFASA